MFWAFNDIIRGIMGDCVLVDVLGNTISVENQCIAIISGIVSNYTTNNDALDINITKDRWLLKEDPALSASNMLIGNSEELVDELKRFCSKVVLVDITSPLKGRDCERLRKVATLMEKRVAIYCSTSPVSTTSSSSLSDGLKSVVSAMKSDLFAGCHFNDASSSASSVVTKAVAVSYLIVEPYCRSCDVLTSENTLALTACGKLHQELGNEGVTSSPQLPPIVIGAAPFSTVYEDVLLCLHTAGADLSRVVFNHVALTHSSVDYWDKLLTTHPCTLCVDCMGYAATFSPPDGPMYPNDTEILTAVVELCRRGHITRLCLSLSIYCKLQLTAFGGYGFQYLERVIRPRLISMGLDNETVQQLCCSNMMKLLTWRQRLIEKVKEVETLPCHICGKTFPAASDFFSKFHFVYCSSKCLAVHRKADFK